MNDYAIKQESSTSDSTAIGVARLMVGTLLVMQLGVGQGQETDISLTRRPPVRIEEISKTFGQHTNSFTGDYEIQSVSFEETVASFYAQFLAAQEPLGKEFEQVLYDNLWDLLVRT